MEYSDPEWRKQAHGRDMGKMDQILARALAGDEEAENELFQQLSVRFGVFVRYILRRNEEEIVQEACLTVLKKYRTLGPSDNFQAWAFGVLKNKIGNYFERQKREQKRMRSDSSTHRSVEWADEERIRNLKLTLNRCLEKIDERNPRYGQILVLSYQGFSCADVCQRLGISPNNAYVTLNRARQMLKACLDKDRV